MMRGLSLLQPWGWLMTEPGPDGFPVKPVENRPWHLPPKMRGIEFAVCASAGMTGKGYTEASLFASVRGVIVPPFNDLRRGVVLGTAVAFDCVCPGSLPLSTADMAWSMPGQHVHLWRSVRKLDRPIPIKGALGFFTVPPEIEAAIREQLPVLEAA